mmetsp:Transcript_20441/g.51913  ORF Transcript_20441/g.51913 Transcript_20441/m.51913 type:complete len:287 (+) Transcript_20441:815-1675(+)
MHQHFSEVDASPLGVRHRPRAPGDAGRLRDLIELTPPIPATLESGSHLSLREPRLEVLKSQAHRLGAHTLDMQPVLDGVDHRYRVVVPDEPHRYRGQPIVHDQLARDLGTARFVVVEDEAGMPVVGVCVVWIRAQVGDGQGVRDVADAHALEQPDRRAAALVLLVDAPEGLDVLAGRKQDLVLSARVVCDEFGDVVDTVLVGHPNPVLHGLVQCDLRPRVYWPRLGCALHLPQAFESFFHLLQLLRRQGLGRLLVLHHVDMLGLHRAILRRDLRLSNVEAVALEQV